MLILLCKLKSLNCHLKCVKFLDRPSEIIYSVHIGGDSLFFCYILSNLLKLTHFQLPLRDTFLGEFMYEENWLHAYYVISIILQVVIVILVKEIKLNTKLSRRHNEF